ncbi:hypothetical protein B9J07_18080 [Sinorhizobium sp. LM21]|nr:hypothetical protein B9J07_18080 [Sinorhizobium sp. LM21]
MGSTDNTAQLGVNAVEKFFLDRQWLFRRQLESDVGIDAQVEITANGKPTGQLIALQIKSGPSHLRKHRDGVLVYYGERRHLEYWDNHSLPVLLMVHIPDEGVTYWERIERHKVSETAKGWSIQITDDQVLNEYAADYILRSLPRSDPESRRRQRMTLDVDLIRRVENEEPVFVTIEHWVNKFASFRGASFSFGEPGNQDVEFRFFSGANSPDEVFDWLFPWLSYHQDDDPRDISGEILIYTFEVTLNELGRAFLMLEDYYVMGIAPFTIDDAGLDDDGDQVPWNGWDEEV